MQAYASVKREKDGSHTVVTRLVADTPSEFEEIQGAKAAHVGLKDVAMSDSLSITVQLRPSKSTREAKLADGKPKKSGKPKGDGKGQKEQKDASGDENKE